MYRSILITVFILFFLPGCKKEQEKITVPIVKTLPAEDVGRYSVWLSGDVNFDEGTGVMSRGIYYSTKENPTMADSTTVHEPVTGTVTDTVVGLTPDTTYSFRAYAEYTSGVVFGEQLSFTTRPAEPIWGDGVTDIDGNFYKSVIIGEQEWMAENLKVTRYRNGDLIETTEPATKDISEETEPKYQWAYENDPEYAAIFGRLYTWHAATDSRGICPEGWYMPSAKEWKELIQILGGEDNAGGKLKQTGTTYWMEPNAGATNETGFSALAGGIKRYNGDFVWQNTFGIWMSSSETYDIYSSIYCFVIQHRFEAGFLSNHGPYEALAVRCMKD